MPRSSCREVKKIVEQKRPILILISGLPGTGKSTLARKLSRKYKLEHISTDSVRKRIFRGVRKAEFNKGYYSERDRFTVYETIFYLVYTLLKHNVGCVVDGTFYKETLRQKLFRIARKFNAKFLLIIATCPERVVKERFKQREKLHKRTLSDADFAIYLKLKEIFEPTTLPHLKINLITDPKNILNKIENALKRDGFH